MKPPIHERPAFSAESLHRNSCGDPNETGRCCLCVVDDEFHVVTLMSARRGTCRACVLGRQRHPDKLSLAAHAKLLKDARSVLFGRANTDPEFDRDRRVRRPSSKIRQHFALAISQRLGARRKAALNSPTISSNEETLTIHGSIDRVHQLKILGAPRHTVRSSCQQPHSVIMRRSVREHKNPRLRTDRSQTLNRSRLGPLTKQRGVRLTPQQHSFRRRVRRATIQQTRPGLVSQQHRDTKRDHRVESSQNKRHGTNITHTSRLAAGECTGSKRPREHSRNTIFQTVPVKDARGQAQL